MTFHLVVTLAVIGCALPTPSHSYDIYINRRPPPVQELSADVGVPLILTPLIEKGQISEALKQAAVTDEPFTGLNKNIVSYSGFLTVDKLFNSNLFFWFFQSQGNPKTDPVLLWLQGGPGSSSLFALFTENGPYIVNKNLSLSYREYSWTKNHSVLFIDNPAGTGFSFTSGGYAKNETKVGEDLYEFLLQFFTLFPDLQTNDFFITGESYGGHYIPAIGYTIYQKNPKAALKINLKGVAIGNPLTDAQYQTDFGPYFYFAGLIDDLVLDTVNTQHASLLSAINSGNFTAASNLLNDIRSTTRKASAIPNVYNHQDIVPSESDYWVDYLIQETIRIQIHVGNVSYGRSDSQVSQNLFDDKTKSVGPWLGELINNYKVLLFNGQLDTMDPYPLMVNLIRNLNFTSKPAYLKEQRKIWYVGSEVAGYSKSAGNFTEVLVRDAGHMVPTYQPKWAYDLIYKFVRNLPIGTVTEQDISDM